MASKSIFHYTNLPGMDYAALSVYVYIAAHKQDQLSVDGSSKPNGLQGWCYRTKKRMVSDLKISKVKLDACLRTLQQYGLIQVAQCKNKYGGKPLKYHKPLRPSTKQALIEKYPQFFEVEETDGEFVELEILSIDEA
ncbi:hypothetical protein LCY76_09385 [Fictibacillus sp. KIGAM418]|uniref:Uncharacterized protein n=1 Tax=Fictibacillus marinisediminis TaxID=2878389 RepID=A0A9X1XA08_9BACL|nr:hypothetical protein [Fictibacillus marinisediminis]MCK6256806.1 hypothetical protein [Fictibacillus marinisediminis]